MARVILYSVFLLVGSALLLFGIGRAVVESRVLARYEPIEVHIESLDIERSSDADGNTQYEPRARFTYEVDGQAYTSGRVLLTVLHYPSESRAERLLEPFEVGQSATAWHDPDDPAQAVLAPLFNPISHMLAAVGGAVLAGVALVWSGDFSRRSLSETMRPTHALRLLNAGPVKPKPHPTGRLLKLTPPTPLSTRLVCAVTAVALWGGSGAVALLLYLRAPVDAAPVPELGMFAMLFYVLMGVVALIVLGEVVRRAIWFRDATIWLTRDHLVAGERNPLAYEQPLVREARVRELVVGVRLITLVRAEDERGNSKKRKVQELQSERVTLIEGQRVAPGEPIRVKGAIDVPSSPEPGPSAESRDRSRLLWLLWSRLELEGGAHYELEFPVEVVAEGHEPASAAAADAPAVASEPERSG